MFKKTFAVLLLALVLCMSLPAEAVAAQRYEPVRFDEPVVAYSSTRYLISMLVGLPYTGDRALPYASILCTDDVKFLQAEFTMQRRPSSNLGTPWEDCARMNFSGMGNYLDASEPYYMERGYQYRTLIRVYAYGYSGSSYVLIEKYDVETSAIGYF